LPRDRDGLGLGRKYKGIPAQLLCDDGTCLAIDGDGEHNLIELERQTQIQANNDKNCKN
jgi:hypothetical protein